ncbi:MAG: hypothetical protein H6Q72_1897 [Firmicutes bacterium]|nr:hypothetical protein [Bacillota bacterium]
MVEAANWARYQEKAGEVIQQIVTLQIAEAPTQAIIQNPQAFRNWVEQCKQIYAARNR